MSKLLPDPQIQSLRAMRAGDIAMPAMPTITIGKVSAAVLNPTAGISVSVTAADTNVAATTISESLSIGIADVTTVSLDVVESFSPTAVDATVSAATTNENMTVGIGTTTSVTI